MGSSGFRAGSGDSGIRRRIFLRHGLRRAIATGVKQRGPQALNSLAPPLSACPEPETTAFGRGSHASKIHSSASAQPRYLREIRKRLNVCATGAICAFAPPLVPLEEHFGGCMESNTKNGDPLVDVPWHSTPDRLQCLLAPCSGFRGKGEANAVSGVDSRFRCRCWVLQYF